LFLFLCVSFILEGTRCNNKSVGDGETLFFGKSMKVNGRLIDRFLEGQIRRKIKY